MQRARRLPVSALSPHFTCMLCDGYIVDATTIAECLHSFCRTCIVRYLETSKFCPVCDVQVHETKPLQGIRFDQTLQDIVYKLIPGLYQNEMQKRREFYAQHPEAAVHCSSEERGEGAEQKFFYSPDETISLTLEYRNGPQGEPSDESAKKALTRHLNCPAALSVSHLKKFISMKFGIPQPYTVEVMYADHILRDDDTLMDIAYIYAWKRAGPMKFHYNITKRIVRRWELPAAPKPRCVPPTPEAPPDVPCETRPEEKMDVDDDEKLVPAPTETETPVTNSAECQPAEETRLTPEPPPCSNSSLPKAPVAEPPRVDPLSYGTVKLLSTSDTNTILSTANGVRLKLIHPPHTNPRGRPRKSKKKCKAAPVQRLARLAPYPPPAAPLLPPLAKLVPTVMTSLPPALVTSLVSSTANTLCNASRTPVVASYLNQTNVLPTTLQGPSAPLERPPTTSQSFANGTSATPRPIAAKPPVNSAPPCVVAPVEVADEKTADPPVVPPALSSPPSKAPAKSDSVLPKEPESSSCIPPGSESNSNTKAAEPSSSCESSVSASVSVASRPSVECGTTTTTTSAPSPVVTSNVPEPVPMDTTEAPRVRGPTEPVFCASFGPKDASYEASVKNSISAEFSDNDDLGCPPDLVVDEQKMDSSDNEDDALRKKITAIAEKDDEADATDDTEADSGRASDISSQARSSCDDDVGSPAPQGHDPPAPVPPEEPPRPSKPSTLNDVIDHLYRQKKDNVGALDLSLCARKPAEAQRPKAVANPVLDIKHRQQTYLPAPSKQHTACPPAPAKHPTSPSLLLHHLSVHHGMLHGKPPAHHLPMPFPGPRVSSPRMPAYGGSPVPSAHQGMMPFLPGLLQYGPALYGKAPLPGRSTPKHVPSPPLPKSPSFGKASPSRKSVEKSPASRGSPPVSTTTTCIQVSHPRASPSLMRMLTQHRSASPAPCPKAMASAAPSPSSATIPTSLPSPSYKPPQPSIPIYKKSDSYKNFSTKFKGSNLTVFNPDPNGYRQKIVIKNLDVRPGGHR